MVPLAVHHLLKHLSRRRIVPLQTVLPLQQFRRRQDWLHEVTLRNHCLLSLRVHYRNIILPALWSCLTVDLIRLCVWSPWLSQRCRAFAVVRFGVGSLQVPGTYQIVPLSYDAAAISELSPVRLLSWPQRNVHAVNRSDPHLVLNSVFNHFRPLRIVTNRLISDWAF